MLGQVLKKQQQMFKKENQQKIHWVINIKINCWWINLRINHSFKIIIATAMI